MASARKLSAFGGPASRSAGVFLFLGLCVSMLLALDVGDCRRSVCLGHELRHLCVGTQFKHYSPRLHVVQGSCVES